MLPVSRAGASKSDSQEWTLFDLPLARGKHPGHCKRSILRIEAISLRNEAVRMPLYWLCYHRDNQISVVIGPDASLIHVRMRAALANLDQGEFAEGHELDRKWKVAKQVVGRRLSHKETSCPDCTANPSHVRSRQVRTEWTALKGWLHLRR
jgi:hypothetical protein